MDHQARAAPPSSLGAPAPEQHRGDVDIAQMSSMLSIEPVLERALHARVERVEAVQRERLGRAEAPAWGGVGAVVAEHAVREREPAALVEAGGALVEHALSQHEVAEQPPFVAEADIG